MTKTSKPTVHTVHMGARMGGAGKTLFDVVAAGHCGGTVSVAQSSAVLGQYGVRSCVAGSDMGEVATVYGKRK